MRPGILVSLDNTSVRVTNCICSCKVFNISRVIVLLHTPDKFETVAPEQVWDEPYTAEEPPSRVTEEAAHLNSDVRGCGPLVTRLSDVIPNAPSVVLQDLVVHDSAEVEEVAESAHEDQADRSALDWLEVFAFDQEDH